MQQPSGLAEDPTLPHEGLERVASGSGKLELHELTVAANAIRLKIQKARSTVKELPDLERSVEEQDEELGELEERIEKQRAMLGKLGVREVGEEDRK